MYLWWEQGIYNKGNPIVVLCKSQCIPIDLMKVLFYTVFDCGTFDIIQITMETFWRLHS